MLLDEFASNLPEGHPAKVAAVCLSTGLTRRQFQVLLALCEDLKQDELATKLNISPSTFNVHVCAIYKALKVRSRVGAVLWAVRNGAFDLLSEQSACVPTADPTL